jgi:hypothetical protein
MRLAFVRCATALALILAAPAIGYAAADAAKLYFLLPNSTTIRFTTRDAPLCVAALKKLAPSECFGRRGCRSYARRPLGQSSIAGSCWGRESSPLPQGKAL